MDQYCNEMISPAPGCVQPERPQGQRTMSYWEALRSAMAGRLDHQVIRAFRTEHAAAELAGPTFRLVHAKINLGSALLNMANDATSPAEYVGMYQESEELLLAAMKLDPSNADARHNIDMVRQNRLKRPGVEAGAATTAATSHNMLHGDGQSFQDRSKNGNVHSWNQESLDIHFFFFKTVCRI